MPQPRILRLTSLLALSLAIFLTGAAQGMTYETKDGALILTGAIDDSDYTKFNAAFTEQISKVVLQDSPGGDLWTALKLGKAIARRGVDTEVAGPCRSGCAIIFLGGKRRSYAAPDRLDAKLPYVAFHDPYDKMYGDSIPRVTAEMHRWIRDQTDDKIGPEFFKRFSDGMSDHNGGVYFFPIRMSKYGASVFNCSGATDLGSCKAIPDLTARALGIVTDDDAEQTFLATLRDLLQKKKTAEQPTP